MAWKISFFQSQWDIWWPNFHKNAFWAPFLSPFLTQKITVPFLPTGLLKDLPTAKLMNWPFFKLLSQGVRIGTPPPHTKTRKCFQRMKLAI